MIYTEVLLPVIIVFIIIGLPIMCGTLVKLARIIKGDSTGGGKDSNPVSNKEEAEIVQDINNLVSKLEKRIDALETIVLDKSSR